MPNVYVSSSRKSNEERHNDVLKHQIAVLHRRRQHIEKQLSNVAHQKRLLVGLEQKLKVQLQDLDVGKVGHRAHEVTSYNAKPSLSRTVPATAPSKQPADPAIPATKVRYASHHRKITLDELNAYLDSPASWNTEEETFVCPVCQNKYRAARLGQVKRHLIIHITDRRCIMPFSCPVPKCKYAAFKLCEVKRHAQTHSLKWADEMESSCMDKEKKARLDSLMRS